MSADLPSASAQPPSPAGELPMLVLGGRNPLPYAERFRRLQRRADLLLGNARCKRGLYLFRSHEEYEAWKMIQRLRPPASPKKPT